MTRQTPIMDAERNVEKPRSLPRLTTPDWRILLHAFLVMLPIGFAIFKSFPEAQLLNKLFVILIMSAALAGYLWLSRNQLPKDGTPHVR